MHFSLTRHVIPAAALFILVSCGGAGWGSGYSHYGFYAAPDETVSSFEAREKNLSAAEHFILANAYKDKGELKKAAVHFANSAFVQKRNLSLKPFPGTVYNFMKKMSIRSAFYDDAALELSLIFMQYSEYEYAQKLADLVSSDDISLYREAVLVKAKALDVRKKYNEAEKILTQGIKDMPDKELTTVLNIRLASVFRKNNDNDAAVRALNEVIRITPDGWQAAAAGKEILDIVKDAAYPSFDAVLAVKGLLAAKEFGEAEKLAAGSISAGTYDNDSLLVQIYAGKGSLADADKIIASYDKASAEYARLLSIKAGILWQKGRRAEAVSDYEEVISSGSGYDAKSELKRVCFYSYENNRANAPEYLVRYADLYPKDKNAGKMLWLAAKPYIEKKNFQPARPFLDRIIRDYPDGDYSGHARFWIYKSLTAENKKDEAEKVFRSMPLHSGGSVYTWILLNRKKADYTAADCEKIFDDALSASDADSAVFAHAMLFMKDGDTAARESRMKKLSSEGMNPYGNFNGDALSLSLVSRYSSVLKQTEKYFAAGHSEGINRVFNALVIPADEAEAALIEADKSRVLAVFGGKYGHYYSQISGMTGILESYNLQENLFLMSSDSASAVLPSGFADIVAKEAAASGIAKNFLYSIIKAESAFNNKAVSGAGALGLMQLMPPTAKDVAKKLKVAQYDMKNPADAIRFGANYLSWLDRFFKGNFREMVAGYNAGAGNVQKWKKQFAGSDEDLFTEQVPFEETRGYMLRTEKFLIQYGLFVK
ncbi:MAG: transglycosylase SLT domain-containing protein [Spirochaetota bacterium]